MSSVIYHVYVRSYFDSNDDGVGDLNGLKSKLDYIQSCGANAVWISPVHPSPNNDWGYDVSDFNSILPEYGSMEDFDSLIEKAASKKIHIILDEVFSHTSNQHPWFVDSSWGGQKKDWYVWAEPKEDGTPPNNWLSVFGGPAWKYNPLTREYYFHKFFESQPKLNLHNPEVRAEILNVLSLWLDKGVSGFRLDVANTYAHDSALRDNPPVPPEQRTDWHWLFPPRLQQNIYDANRPENAAFLREIRAVANKYDDAFMFGEFSERPDLIDSYSGGKEGLHSFYTFELLDLEDITPKKIADIYGQINARSIWPLISFSNHDVTRATTRLFPKQTNFRSNQAKLILFMLMTLRGTPIIFQGEELGLQQTDMPTLESIRDSVGKEYFPLYKGRDGARTPMSWSTTKNNNGFSEGEPWIHTPKYESGYSVDEQHKEPTSILNFFRKLSEFRNNNHDFIFSSFETIEASDDIWRFKRGEHLAYVNFSEKELEIVPEPNAECVLSNGLDGYMLQPYGCALFRK
ncbi:alpha-amylase family glycosyl hydrolase [Hyphococcus flavus]|uniref:Alpha-amylase family glycosyl hydrolase n=2 Tax=Hyphococcus flavus TaxID=1866326 RepID=A0AAF0CG97_9PROT|nr:alpha-amylase family glycosyl hydrolase [Hyphococcus flavus]WDI33251.1 alpha-amylase family glycosyl hydrolase [Hyphococcus flavus]